MIGIGHCIRVCTVRTPAKFLSGCLPRRGDGRNQEGYGVEIKRDRKSGVGSEQWLISILKVKKLESSASRQSTSPSVKGPESFQRRPDVSHGDPLW